MLDQNSPLAAKEIASTDAPIRNGRWQSSFFKQLAVIAVACSCSCAALGIGFWFGQQQFGQQALEQQTLSRQDNLGSLPQMLAASAAAGENMAVATGPISEDSEGIFFLDFITGDLQCLVYYPRYRSFGAHYFGNVVSQLGGGKNSKYLMVTGQTLVTGTATNTRPGASLVYVTNVTTGLFAAYAVPWNRTAESSGTPQSGPLVYAGGGPVRGYQLPDPGQIQPAAIVDPNKK